MVKKIIDFFDAHAEKLVWGVVIILSLVFLSIRVITSPNRVKFDNKMFGAGNIDKYINEQAENVRIDLERNPEKTGVYDPCLPAFTQRYASALSGVQSDAYLPMPAYSPPGSVARGKYTLPDIGEVNAVEAVYFRAAAYVPTELINDEKTYDQAQNEVNDIDFVTIGADIDVVELYDRFYDSFVGYKVKEEWRDPCLAVPIFAAVELQRQYKTDDKNWSEWTQVPRTKIDSRKKLLEIVEDVESLPAGGMKVRLLQYKEWEVTRDLLQPEGYQIASAEEDWFPPSLRQEYVKQRDEEAKTERMKIRDEKKKEKEQKEEQNRTQRSSRTSSSRTSRSGSSASGAGGRSARGGRSSQGGQRRGGGMDDEDGGIGRGGRLDRDRMEKERLRREKLLAAEQNQVDIYEKLDDLSIIETTDFTKMEKSLYFWANDDSVEPGKTYRYRIRLGVFNPIAGTNQFNEEHRSRKNEVILWSQYSEPTQIIEVPQIQYAFPVEVQKSPKTVTVQIYRYRLGYWHSKKFRVKQGELIGKVAPYEPPKDEDTNIDVPEEVDYSTGAMLVDLIAVNDWIGGSGRKFVPREYYNMLYSYDGNNMERIAVQPNCWEKSLQTMFAEVRVKEKLPKKQFQAWGKGKFGRRRRGLRRGTTTDEMMMDEDAQEMEYFMD